MVLEGLEKTSQENCRVSTGQIEQREYRPENETGVYVCFTVA